MSRGGVLSASQLYCTRNGLGRCDAGTNDDNWQKELNLAQVARLDRTLLVVAAGEGRLLLVGRKAQRALSPPKLGALGGHLQAVTDNS